MASISTTTNNLKPFREKSYYEVWRTCYFLLWAAYVCMGVHMAQGQNMLNPCDHSHATVGNLVTHRATRHIPRRLPVKYPKTEKE